MKIIATAPTRCGLIGGGTDVNPFAAQFGGQVLSFALNLRMRAILIPHPKPALHLKSLGEERLLHSLDRKLNYGKDPKFDLIRAIINYFFKDIPSGFSLETRSLAPNVMGLGSSGAVAVATIGAFSHWLGKSLSPMETALLAFRLETEELGWPGGKQDQLAAAFGGINKLTFGPDSGVGVIPQKFPQSTLKKLKNWSVMIFVGGYRHSKEQQKALTKGMTIKTKQQALLHLKNAVSSAIAAIAKNDFNSLGKILDHAWEDKKRSNPIASNAVIDHFYTLAKNCGALGGKIMGAGGAGNMFFIIPPQKQAGFKAAVTSQEAKIVPFDFDFDGLRIVERA